MERAAYADAAKQTEMFDEELAALNPSPFEFRFKFEDDSTHDFQNGDWEAHAMFYRELKRTGRESEVLDWMDNTFNVEYPKNGMLFAVGNMAKRPQTWQLLGVLRVNEPDQGALKL